MRKPHDIERGTQAASKGAPKEIEISEKIIKPISQKKQGSQPDLIEELNSARDRLDHHTRLPSVARAMPGKVARDGDGKL
jgi:hypothetical protein